MIGWRFVPASCRLRLVAILAAILLLSLGCAARAGSPRAAPATDARSLEALVEVMGQRLALMPLVAEWKRAHDQGVRDRPRELQVLNEAVVAVETAARKAGVKPFPEGAVRRFYQAQIDAAVEIQEHILSKPAKPRTRAVPDLKTVIRPELDRLGNRIADLLVAQSVPPDRSRLERLARQHWQVEGLEPEATRHLVDALEGLWEGRFRSYVRIGIERNRQHG